MDKDTETLVFDLAFKVTEPEREKLRRMFTALNKGNCDKPKFSILDCLKALKEKSWQVPASMTYLKALQDEQEVDIVLFSKRQKVHDVRNAESQTECETSDLSFFQTEMKSIGFFTDILKKIDEKMKSWRAKFSSNTRVAKTVISDTMEPIEKLITKGLDCDMSVEEEAFWSLELGLDHPEVQMAYSRITTVSSPGRTEYKCNFVCPDGSTCTHVQNSLHTKLHILGKHLQRLNFGYKCSACPKEVFYREISVETHMSRKHGAVLPFTCEECGMDFAIQSSIIGHANSHPWATGEKLPDFVFDVDPKDKFKIIVRSSKSTDRSVITELWLSPWLHHDKVTLPEKLFSCGFSNKRDAKEAAKAILAAAHRSQLNGKDILGCGSIRDMEANGFELQVEESVGTRIYCASRWVANQLKWIIRRKLNCVFIIAPREAEARLSDVSFLKYLDEKLQPFMDQMKIHDQLYMKQNMID